jgi:transmembrane serine protease 11D
MKLRFALATAIAMVPMAASSVAPSTRAQVEQADLENLQDLREFVRDVGRLSITEQQAIIGSLRMDPRIVGGRLVKIADHPWQVALIRGYATNRYQFCGGTLIAPDVVLTAAHCIDNNIVQNDPTRLDILAGTDFFPEAGERLDVQAIYVHPQWNDTNNDYDVAVVKLRSPATLGRPIAIGTADVAAGTTATVTGWGALTEGGLGSPDLMGVALPVVDTAACSAAESYGATAITSRMLCAGEREGGKDSCQGDSGGPLTAGTGTDARLIGVVSWGEGCARRLKYGVYTRLSAVAPWVQSLIGA